MSGPLLRSPRTAIHSAGWRPWRIDDGTTTDRGADLDPHLNDRPWERAGASIAPLLLWLTTWTRCLTGLSERNADWWARGDRRVVWRPFGCAETPSTFRRVRKDR